jgi:hypothetical protein
MRMMNRMMVGVLLLSASHALAEDEVVEAEERPAARTVLTTDVLGMLRGTLQLEGEHAVTNWLSVRLGVGFSFHVTRSDALAFGVIAPFQSPLFTESVSQGWGVNAEPGLRFFLSGTAPEGLWVGPHLGLSMFRTGFENLSGEQQVSVSDGRTVTLYGDLLVGYTLLLPKGFTLQAAVGVRTGQSTSTTWTRALTLPDGELVPLPGTPFRSTQWNTQPATRLAFGWTF